ncbi:MAG: hypothetical protein MRZ91_00895, partial [Christensenellaceae bacterium]|nr:hypothetical protein [Christensenellaceae bacterium]
GRLSQPGQVIYAGDEDFTVFSQAAVQYSKIDFSVKADKAYMTDLLTDLREHYILVKNYYTEDIYNFESSLRSNSCLRSSAEYCSCFRW